MKPRILLVEDDTTSALFLATAAEALPARVDVVATRAAASARAGEVDYALWLVDAHLPDGDGAGLLAELRGRGLATPAIAHTAARDESVHGALREAGFEAVLVKPLEAAALRTALAAALAGRRTARVAEPGLLARARAAMATAVATAVAAPDKAPDPDQGPPAWDDAASLRALNGEQAHVDGLRELFLAELPTVHGRAMAAARHGDHAGLRANLHRLRAGCGFVGAARLGEAVAALHDAPGSVEALARFDTAAQELLSRS